MLINRIYYWKVAHVLNNIFDFYYISMMFWMFALAKKKWTDLLLKIAQCIVKIRLFLDENSIEFFVCRKWIDCQKVISVNVKRIPYIVFMLDLVGFCWILLVGQREFEWVAA